MDLLGGTKRTMITEEEKEEEITRELINQLQKLKKRKAPGENVIENDAWRFI